MPNGKLYLVNGKLYFSLCFTFFNQFLQLFVEIVILFRFEFRVVHLLADVNHFLEVIHYLIEVVELKFRMADVDNHVQDFFLTFHGSYGVNLVESILLQDNEVNQFRFPEGYVIFHGYTVIAENVDLPGPDAFPMDLSSIISNFYGRAGYVYCPRFRKTPSILSRSFCRPS